MTSEVGLCPPGREPITKNPPISPILGQDSADIRRARFRESTRSEKKVPAETFFRYLQSRYSGKQRATQVRVGGECGSVFCCEGRLGAQATEGWRSRWWYYLKRDPNLESLHDEPEFQAMVAEIEADMAAQLARVREMERNGELEPIPEVSAATH